MSNQERISKFIHQFLVFSLFLNPTLWQTTTPPTCLFPYMILFFTFVLSKSYYINILNWTLRDNASTWFYLIHFLDLVLGSWQHYIYFISLLIPKHDFEWGNTPTPPWPLNIFPFFSLCRNELKSCGSISGSLRHSCKISKKSIGLNL